MRLAGRRPLAEGDAVARRDQVRQELGAGGVPHAAQVRRESPAARVVVPGHRTAYGAGMRPVP